MNRNNDERQRSVGDAIQCEKWQKGVNSRHEAGSGEGRHEVRVPNTINPLQPRLSQMRIRYYTFSTTSNYSWSECISMKRLIRI